LQVFQNSDLKQIYESISSSKRAQTYGIVYSAIHLHFFNFVYIFLFSTPNASDFETGEK